MKIDLGWYQHRISCAECMSSTWPELTCPKSLPLKLRFKRKGKAQQEEARKFGHTNVIGFVDYV